MPEDARCPAAAQSLAAADAKVGPLRVALKEAQSEFKDAVEDGIKGGHYASAVKVA
ncbi:hypothetical protein [Massilia glaciei]|uniref:hypothetical protein n=1 Tax=Massilia glaciei TaxID=1524097 RepID=UPI0015E824B2|nr:hypothetical protein [Massilia glaciei]